MNFKAYFRKLRVALLLIGLLLVCGTDLALSQQNLQVHYLEVGQGDASLVISPSNKTILIDGGDIDKGSTVVSFLKSQKIKQLDLVVATHPHADHIGGLVDVLENILVKELLDSGQVHTSRTLEKLLTLVDKKNIKYTAAKAGQVIKLDPALEMVVLAPSDPPIKKSSLNNNSVVLKITHNKIAFLFMGDLEKEGEKRLLNKDIKSALLKVGHHGSRTSTSSGFLKKVKPAVALISCGIGNKYGHPHEVTLTKLEKAGIKIYRTDINGNIEITTDGKTYNIKTERQ